MSFKNRKASTGSGFIMTIIVHADPPDDGVLERECDELRGQKIVQAVFSANERAAYVVTDGKWNLLAESANLVLYLKGFRS